VFAIVFCFNGKGKREKRGEGESRKGSLRRKVERKVKFGFGGSDLG